MSDDPVATEPVKVGAVVPNVKVFDVAKGPKVGFAERNGIPQG
jgi:hypothetical protein